MVIFKYGAISFAIAPYLFFWGSMNNIEQFSIYTAKIFEELYSTFPIPKYINQDEIITMHLQFDKHDEIREYNSLKNSSELSKIIHEASPELAKWDYNDQKNLDEISSRLKTLKNAEHEDKDRQLSIYKSTLEFLKDEGLIVLIPYKGYRLTSKSFSHLNKTFEDATLTEKESFIASIRGLFSETKSISRDVLVGTAITIIPKLLGYN